MAVAEVGALELSQLGGGREDGLVDLELVLEHGADVGQGELELELAVAVHEVAVLQRAELHEFPVALDCKGENQERLDLTVTKFTHV